MTTERAIHPEIVPREVFKFELSDAKIPDFTQYPRFKPQEGQDESQPKTSPPQQQPPQSQPKKRQSQPGPRRARQKQARARATERSASAASEDQSAADAEAAGSRIMEIVHPSPIAYEPVRGRTLKDLPLSVQKAISHALKQDYNIPHLDTIKYYLKDPAVRISGGKLSSLDSHLKPWWQSPVSVKTYPEQASFSAGPQRLSAVVTTPKPLAPSSAAPFAANEYVTYPLLRGYPVHYSANANPSLSGASSGADGVSFLYGDRIYTKIPYNLALKSADSSNANDAIADVKPIVEIQSSTPNSLTSTSPVVFPSAIRTPSPAKAPAKSYVHYYSAEEGAKDAQNGALLSNDKNTLNLITKAVNAIKKHNPHLDVVPKRIENDELIVHVTPKPEYFITAGERVKSAGDESDKNLAYLTNEPVSSKQKAAKVVNHHYLKQIHVPAHHDDSVSSIFVPRFPSPPILCSSAFSVLCRCGSRLGESLAVRSLPNLTNSGAIQFNESVLSVFPRLSAAVRARLRFRLPRAGSLNRQRLRTHAEADG